MIVIIAPGFFLHHIFQSTCGLVAMTSASHAEGRQFDPGQVYFLWVKSNPLFFACLFVSRFVKIHPARIELATFSVLG